MTVATRDPALAALSREEAARRRSSPRVRRLAAEQGIALGDIVGTGFGGRVRPDDLAAFTKARGVAISVALSASAVPPTVPGRRTAAEQPRVRREPVPAELLVFEIDTTASVRWRDQQAEEVRRRYGARLSELAVVVWAVAAALNAAPGVNVAWDEQWRSARRVAGVHLAVATAASGAPTGASPVAPVLHDADRLSLAGVAGAVDELVRRGGAGLAAPEDGAGVGFLVEYGGAPQALSAAPLIVSPYAARLSTTASERRLVVRTDAAGSDCLAVRSVVRASLAYDVRLIDAVAAARFLHAFRRAIGTIARRSSVG